MRILIFGLIFCFFVGSICAESSSSSISDLDIAKNIVISVYSVNSEVLSSDLDQLKLLYPTSPALDVSTFALESQDTMQPFDPNREYAFPTIEELQEYHSPSDRTSEEIESEIRFCVQEKKFLRDLWDSLQNTTPESSIYLSYIVNPSVLSSRKNEYQQAISKIDEAILQGQTIEQENFNAIIEPIIKAEGSNISSQQNIDTWADDVWITYVSTDSIASAKADERGNAMLAVQELKDKKSDYEKAFKYLENFDLLQKIFQTMKESPEILTNSSQ